MKDYYKILEVNKSASPEVISKVYKTLAKKYHPDANLNNIKEAEAKFKEITEAYEVLSDEQKRKEYDIKLEAYNKSQKSADSKEYENLKSYVSKLENQINNMQQEENLSNNNTKNTKSKNTNTKNNEANTILQTLNNQAYEAANNKGYQDALRKAYEDSYYNTLRRLGYTIKHKKTFKQKLKDFITNILIIIIIATCIYVAWHIPSFRENVLSLFDLKNYKIF